MPSSEMHRADGGLKRGFIAAIAVTSLWLASPCAYAEKPKLTFFERCSDLLLGKKPEFQIVHDTIPMKDGTKLAVTLYVPTRLKSKVPALLEYLPYRKDDQMALRNYDLHTYFARQGFVSASVDIRGTGSSEGTVPDREYSEQEQLDGLEVITWLSKQPWASGNVGMFGISWGGFNAIQLAMRNPPELKAIIAVDATDRLFQDDIHYIDGMLHVDQFSLSMDLENGVTSGPHFPVDEKSLKERFDQTPWSLRYLKEQRNGPFWAKGSLAPNYDRIQIPVFMIGGLLDGYRDSIPRMLNALKVPTKALIGPWNHTYPHLSSIGPTVEWRKIASQWWDQWLNGIDTGVLNEPQITLFQRDSHRPDKSIDQIPGRWLDLASWPKTETGLTFFLGDGLKTSTPSAAIKELEYVPSSGVDTGLWWGDLTGDQKTTDAASLVFDGEVASEAMQVMGRPKIKLWVSSSAKLANWMVRLSDVSPTGEVSLITGGGLSGAQRDSSTEPKELKPGELYPIEIDLHLTSWTLPKGHRLRVSVTNALWPMIFPTPYQMKTTLALGGETPSQIFIPLLPKTAVERVSPLPVPEEFANAPGIVSAEGETWPGKWNATRDEATKTTTLHWQGDDFTQFPWGNLKNFEELRYMVKDDEPATSSVTGRAATHIELKGRKLIWSVILTLRADEKNFYYRFTRLLFENGTLLRRKSWVETIPRDHH